MGHLEEMLNRTNIHTIFPKLRSLRGAFVLRFEAEVNHRMSAHIDSPGTNGHLLSVVVSSSNHNSGSVEMSNRDDGTIVDTNDFFLSLQRVGLLMHSTGPSPLMPYECMYAVYHVLNHLTEDIHWY